MVCVKGRHYRFCLHNIHAIGRSCLVVILVMAFRCDYARRRHRAGERHCHGDNGRADCIGCRVDIAKGVVPLHALPDPFQ